MSLSIRFEEGPQAGQLLTFGAGVEQVVIGRDPEACQVRLPADDRRVGRQHLALRRVLDGFRLVVKPEHRVLVDGREAFDGETIGPSANIQLGDDGPRLAVVNGKRAELPATLMPGKRLSGLVTQLRLAQRHARLGRRMAAAAILMVLAAAVVGYYGWDRMDTRLGSDRQQVAHLASMTGEHTRVVGELSAADESHRQDLAQLTQVTSEQGDALAEVDLTANTLADEVQLRVRDVGLALAQARASTYLVLIEVGGQLYAAGTASVVGDGTLMTNAHVAKLLQEDVKLFVRAPGSDPDTFEVTGTKIHPGYEAFREIWSQYQPVYGNDIDSLRDILDAGAGCDVALLYVKDDGRLAAALPLATTEQLRELSVGDPIAYVGYPSEGLRLVNIRTPSPYNHSGRVIRITDYFGIPYEGPDSFDSAQLIYHDLSSAGGASGSPILTADGYVIGVLSGGNVVGSTQVARIGSSANINFAQRIDLVRELLDDTQDLQQAGRNEQWRDAIRSAYNSGAIILRQAVVEDLLAQWGGFLQLDAPMAEVETAELSLVRGNFDDANGVPVGTAALPVISEGQYMLVAISETNRELDLSLDAAVEGSVMVTDASYVPDWIQFVTFEVLRPTDARVDLRGNRIGDGYELRLFRADLTELSISESLDGIAENWRMWIETTEGTSITVEEVLDTEGVLAVDDWAESATFELDLSSPGQGRYLVVATTADDDDIDMVIGTLVDGTFETLASDYALDKTPLCTIDLDSEAEIRILVYGAIPGIEVTLKVYRAVEEPGIDAG